ncbi:MAG: hypothetical protein EP329_10325 [Deltaproteobacteria bacterium]|nr:MAG: hypothetical protein EP329_10325 [Deltaproteobacteria bacterium]
MNVADVAGALAEIAAKAPSEVVEAPLTDGPAGAWSLVYLPVGARWEAAGQPDRVTSALVLEGLATWATAGVRQTLASGHLVTTAIAAELTAHNDGSAPVSALVYRGVAPMLPAALTE